jgi:EAL domain-containing protein (putative c-di-GMP-specific phosphodiesterase class I)/FixJ family two-component response regulator
MDAVLPSKVHCSVVEDNDGLRALLARTLVRLGCEVSAFESAEAFQTKARDVAPDILLLDVNLPDADAIDVIRFLKEIRFRGVLQLVSGMRADLLATIRQVAERHGIRALPPLAKPFSVQDVEEVLDRYANLSNPVPAPVLGGAGEPDTVLSVDAALRAGWLLFHYQPKVDLKTGKLVGAEALARVDHPDLGLIPHANFLRNASPAELDDLTEACIRTVTRDWTSLVDSGVDLKISINMPVATLHRISLGETLRRERPRRGDWPGLVLEISERESLGDLDRVAEILAQLEIYGSTLAIDNFGIGHSSVSRVRDLTFAELKIDRSFVKGCATNPANLFFCQTAVTLAHRFGAVAVAEGVENFEDLAALRTIGCDIAQGALFSLPVPLESLIEFAAVGWTLPELKPVERRQSPGGRRAEDVLAYRFRERLTGRELEVLKNVVDGQSSKQAARQLGLSPRTVEVHRSRIMSKLGARNVADLLRVVLDN